MLGDQPDRLPGRHRLGLALQGERYELLVAHRGVGGAHRPLAHRHASRPCGALEPRGHVHRVADHRVRLAHRAREHLAGVHAHAQLEVHALGQPGVDLRHRVLHPEARPDGALRVVLVGNGSAEESHDVVADVLVDRSAIALDLTSEPQQRSVYLRLHLLGVHALGEGGVAGQIREQHGHLAAFVERGRGRCHGRSSRAVERGTAVHAEAGSVRRRRAAGPAAPFERLPAVHAEARASRVLGATGRAIHAVEPKAPSPSRGRPGRPPPEDLRPRA